MYKNGRSECFIGASDANKVHNHYKMYTIYDPKGLTNPNAGDIINAGCGDGRPALFFAGGAA